MSPNDGAPGYGSPAGYNPPDAGIIGTGTQRASMLNDLDDRRSYYNPGFNSTPTTPFGARDHNSGYGPAPRPNLFSVDVDSIAQLIGLSEDDRAKLHSFNQSLSNNPISCDVLIYGTLLQVRSQQEMAARRSDSMAATIDSIRQRLQHSFKVPKKAGDIMRKTLRYYLSRAPADYDEEVVSVSKKALFEDTYQLWSKVKAAGLKDYHEDETVKDVTDAWLGSEYRTVKSQFRQHLMDSVDPDKPKAFTTLPKLGKKMFNTYPFYGHKKGGDPTHEHYTRYEILREHAAAAVAQQKRQLADAQRTKGKVSRKDHETNFWEDVNHDLAQKYEEFGEDFRQGERWKTHGEDALARDSARFPNLSASSSEEPVPASEHMEIEVTADGYPVA